MKCAARFVFVLIRAAGLHAEDGYQLWLRYTPTSDPAKLAQYRETAHEFIVQGKSPTAEVIRQESHRGLSGLLKTEVPMVEEITRPGTLIVGTPDNSSIIAGLHWETDLQTQGNEGYVIRSIPSRWKPGDCCRLPR